MSQYLTVQFKRALPAKTFFYTYEVQPGRTYLAEQVDPQTLRVHDEMFANGSAIVEARWGTDWVTDASETSCR